MMNHYTVYYYKVSVRINGVPGKEVQTTSVMANSPEQAVSLIAQEVTDYPHLGISPKQIICADLAE